MSPSLKYLPGIIPAIFGEYVLLLIAVTCYKYYCCCCRSKPACTDSVTSEDQVGDPRVFKFEDTYESYSTGFKYLLFTTRLLSFGYIFGIATVLNYIQSGGYIWFYFTIWNVELLSIYYFFALICSLIGVFRKQKLMTPVGRYYVEDYSGNLKESADPKTSTPLEWSKHTARFGKATHALFSVCLGTAALVTFVNFIFLNPKLTFWNVTSHLVPLLTLLLELTLNNMYMQVNHFAWNISWAWLYMIFVWPLVALGNIKTWPYYFLALDSPYCFLAYTILVVVDIIFYFIMYGFSHLKYICRRIKGDSTEESPSTNHIFNLFVGSSV